MPQSGLLATFAREKGRRGASFSRPSIKNCLPYPDVPILSVTRRILSLPSIDDGGDKKSNRRSIDSHSWFPAAHATRA